MDSINNNLLCQFPKVIKRRNSEPSEGRSSSNRLQMFFQTLAPAPDTNLTPSNPSVARVSPTQQLPASYPSSHFGQKVAHPPEDGSHYSDFRPGKGASLTHQSTSQYSGHNLDKSVSSEYLPYSTAKFGGGVDSHARQETKLTTKAQPLKLAMSIILRNNTANAEVSSMKRPSGDGDFLPSAKRLATSSCNGYRPIPQQSPSTNFMSPVITQPLASTEDIARRPIAQAHPPSTARKDGRAAEPETLIKIEEASNLYTPTHSASSYNHDQQYYETSPRPRATVPTSAEASPRQTAPASFSGNLDHLQGHAASATHPRRTNIAPLVKNEEGAAPLLQQAAPLAEHPDHAVYLDDELDHMRWKMRRVGRKMARQAARAEAHAVDSLARSADANRRIAQLDGEFAAVRKEMVGLQKGVLGLKTRAAEGKMEIEGLRGEVARLDHEVLKLERDALKREVEELRKTVL